MSRAQEAAARADAILNKSSSAGNISVNNITGGRKNLDYQNIFSISGNYIHSNTSTFLASVKRNVGDGFLKEIIDSIKTELYKIISEDIKNFEIMEEKIIKEMNDKIKKSANKNFSTYNSRQEYLSYLNKFRNDIENLESIGFSSFDLIGFKNNLIDANEINKKVFSLVRQIVPQYSAIEAKKKSKKSSSTSSSTLAKMEAEAERVSQENPKFTKEVKNDIDKLTEKFNKEIKQYNQALAIGFSNIIKLTQSILDPNSSFSNEDAKSLKTQIKKLNQLYKSFGINKIPEGENVLIELEKAINRMEPIEFLSRFYNAKARDWLTYKVEALQTDSQLGFLFEAALADTIIKNLLSENSPYKYLTPNVDDVKLVGSSKNFRRVNQMDIQTLSSSSTNKGIKFGFSLKLKGTGDIKLENTEVDILWNNMKNRFKKLEYYEYIRANILSLNVHSESDNTIESLKLRDFLLIEEEILDILLATRLIFGLYEKIENQYKTVGEESLYYIAYIFTKDKVYSSAEILKGMLDSLIKNEKNFNTKYNSLPNPSLPSKSELKNLYEAKKSFIKKMRGQVSYVDIYNNSQVQQAMRNINDNLLDYSLKGAKAYISYTPSK